MLSCINICICACMYFEVLMITTDIHCHSHRSYVSQACWFAVRLLFVCILAESITLYVLSWLTVSSASIFSEWLWLITVSPLILFPWLGWVRGHLFLLCLLSLWFLHGMLVQALVLWHASAGSSSCATLVQALVLRHACAGSSCCISWHNACASVLNRVRTLWYSNIT